MFGDFLCHRIWNEQARQIANSAYTWCCCCWWRWCLLLLLLVLLLLLLVLSMTENAHTPRGPCSAIYWVLALLFKFVNLWLYNHRRMHTKCVCLFSLALICLPFVCLDLRWGRKRVIQSSNRAIGQSSRRAVGQLASRCRSNNWTVACPACK